jgi:phage-related protein
VTAAGGGYVDSGKLKIDVVADLRGFGKELKKKVEAECRGVEGQVKVKAELDADGMRAKLRAVVAELSTETVTLGVTADTSKALADLATVARDRKATIKAEVDRSKVDEVKDVLDRLGDSASKAGGALVGMMMPQLWSGLAIAAVPVIEALAAGLLAVVASASQAVGVIGLLPAALGAAGLAAFTLKLGFTGVGAAMKAIADGDAKKLAEAMKELAPAGRDFVKQIHSLEPAFDKLKRSVQQALLDGVGGAIRRLANEYLPALKSSMTTAAAGMNTAFRSAVAFLRDPGIFGEFRRALNTSGQSVGVLAGAMRPLVSIFHSLFVVGAPFILRTSTYIRDLTERFAGFLTTAKQTGGLASFFDKAVASLTQLGRIVGNVAVGLFGLLRGGVSTGNGLLTTFEKITKTFAVWANSVGGQAAIRKWFEDMRVVGQSLGQALTVLLGIIKRVHEAFTSMPVGVQQAILVTGILVAALAPLTGAIGLVAKAVGFLAPAIAGLVSTFGTALTGALTAGAGGFAAVGTGISAVLGPVGLVVAGVLGVVAVFAALLASSQNLRDAVKSSFTVVKAVITDAINTVKPIFTGMVGIWDNAVMPALQKIGDVIADQVGPAFKSIKTVYEQNVKPALDSLVKAFENNRPAIESFVRGIGNVIAFILRLVPIGTVLSVAFRLIGVVIGVAIQIISRLISVVGAVIRLFASIPGALAAAGRFFSRLWSDIASGAQSMVSAVGGFFSRLGSTLASIASAIGSGITGFFGRMWATVKMIFSGSISDIVARFVRAPFLMIAGIINLLAMLVTFLTNVFVAAAGAVAAGWNAVIRFFVTFPPRAMAAIGSLAGAIGAFFARLWATVQRLTVAGVAGAIAFFAQLPGRAMAAVRSLLSSIGSFFTSVWRGARSAVVTGATSVVTYVAGIPGRIVGALAGLAGRLLQMGRDIIHGLANGIRQGFSAVSSAISGLIDAIPGPIARALGLRSPSRLMHQFGVWITAGLAAGINSTVAVVERAALNMVRVYRNAVNTHIRHASASLLATLTRENAALDRLGDKRAAILKKLAAAEKAYAAQLKASVDYAKQVADSARQSASIVGILGAAAGAAGQAATAGASGVTSVTASLAAQARGYVTSVARSVTAAPGPAPSGASIIVAGLKDRLAKLKAFAADIATLKKKGLNATALGEIIQAGVEQGAEVARALVLGGVSAIASTNTLQAQINKAADALGATAASSMYKSGLNAAKGLIAGLKSQEKALAAQMARIAHLMADQIRRNLGIKSPSTVLETVGHWTARGLEKGLLSRIPVIAALARRMAAAASGATGRLTVGSLSSIGNGPLRPYPGDGRGGGGGAVSISVVASPGMDLDALAAAIAHKLEWSRAS